MKKIQIRMGVFETNSSSTHSMVLCTEEEFELWNKGDLLYTDDHHIVNSKSSFVTKEERDRLVKKGVDESDFSDYNSWGDGYERDVARYTTPKGEKIVVAAYYGYDG